MANSVTISADLPCGSIGNARVVDSEVVEIEVQSSLEFGINGSLETWVCGRLEGHTHAVEVRVVNEHGNMQFLRPVVRRPGEGWRHVVTFGYRERAFRFLVPPAGGNAVEFATWWPYTDSDHVALLDDLSQESVRVEEIGTTSQGRSLHAVAVGDGSQPMLAVVSGFHGGEPSALWATDALLRFAASPEGQAVREAVTLVAVPLVNRDAVAEGLDRRSAGGLDLWFEPGAAAEPEVRAIDEFFAAVKPRALVDIHSWHWVGDGCYTPGWLAAGDDLYARVLDLRAAIDREFPLGGQLFFFDEETCWTTRACVHLGAPAIDAEVSLSRGSDGAWKTRDRARDDGIAILRGASSFVSEGR